MPEKTEAHPLMFVFRDIISGQGFLAGITLSGRCLMVEEDAKWWMLGVRPGGMAESGETPHEALLRFRNGYREILFDMAEEVGTFEDFKQQVEHFYYEPDRQEESRWELALRSVRSGEALPPPPLSGLPKESPDKRPSQITVERLDKESRRIMPSDNVSDVYLSALAA